MKSPLCILHLEDDPGDAALVQATLEAAGIVCEITRVQTREDFVSALEHGGVDLILLDFSLPAFDGLSATRLVRTRWLDIPVILVSGTLGEELAIDSLKSGATDYVLKQRLARLVPAVRRAMQEVEALAERRRMTAGLIEAQKMEVVGQLASGVAHDFNNIMMVVMGYSDLIASQLKEDSPLRQYADQIKHASKRAIGLTRQLLIFTRKHTVLPIVLDLNAVVSELDAMLRRLIDENVEMTIEAGEPIGRVKADSGYVGQILMNLVVNARDAMPNGGKLTISTGNRTLDETYARSHAGAIPGNYVMLVVGDTGTGMSSEVKAHLFEAFFTTKDKSKGTGLGLATCRVIVEHSGGYIEVESEVGSGTTFRIYFPEVGEPLEAAAKAIQMGSLPCGTETLLVVEDDAGLRQLTCGLLKARGYNVLSAINGQDGLRVAREHKGPPIRLVVTDLIMPLMGGKVMAESLKTESPNLKILFTSGHTGDTIAPDRGFGTAAAFLPKPYAPDTLIRKVRELMDQPDQAAA